MQIRNLVTGSTPRVLHRNGNPPEWRARWAQIVAAFFAEAQDPCEPCPELTILTWSNRQTPGLLEQCLDRWRVPYVVLGKDVPEWRNDVKPYLNAMALEEVSSEYVLALDSDDILVVSCPRQILADFRSRGCDILFGTERNSSPDVPYLTEFERSIAEPPYCYLNSGGWIGRAEACRRFFRDCVQEDNGDILALHPTKSIFRDDQGVTRKTFQRHYPAARLDDRCDIFQSLFGVPLDGEVLITTRGREIGAVAGTFSAEAAAARDGGAGIVISLLHSTARLPDGWKPAMEAFRARARDPANVEYILAINHDEPYSLPSDTMRDWGRCALVKEGVTGPNSGYNAAARVSRGNILVTIADDYFPPDGWDEQVRMAIPDVRQEVVLDVENSDGVARLLPFSFLTRAYYDRYGYILYPGYHGFFGDNEFTEQARRDGVIRRARHIVFEHRHPDRGTAPMDAIYARQRSHFEEGKRLFRERKAKGFPKWPG